MHNTLPACFSFVFYNDYLVHGLKKLSQPLVDENLISNNP
jgi:hypothetical protein